MRDYMVLSALLVMLPVALTDVFAAYLLWGWTAVIAIEFYTYTFIPEIRLNLTFAVITLIGLLVQRSRESMQQKCFGLGPTGWLMVVLLAHASLCALFAYPNNQNADIYMLFAKVILFALVMPLVVTSGYRIHAMVLMMVIGLGFHGFDEGAKFISSGGAHLVRGIPKFGDNNHFAVAMCMILPCFFYLTQVSVSKLVRLAAIVACAVTVLAIVGTHSRGGLVCMVAVALWFSMISRRKVLALVFSIICAGLVIALAPASWSERMDTIENAEQDNSFMERVEAWQVSSVIAMANPVFGGGFRAVEVQKIWEQFRGKPGLLGIYTGPPSEIFRAAHSIYFQTMGDMGFVGLFIFLLVLGSVFWAWRDIRRMTKGNEQWRWAMDLSNALSASMVAYMIGGAAVSLAYFESIYMLAMLMEILRQHVRRNVIAETEK